LQEDYQTLREAAAIAEIAPRAQIGLTGRDRASYLHGLLTNDIQNMPAGTGCYATWLTAQGRMTTDIHVLEAGDMMLVDVPEAEVDSVLQRLDQFIFTEDVQLANLGGDLTTVGVHGPQAAAALAVVLNAPDALGAWPQYRNARMSCGNAPVVVARIDQL